MSLCCVQNIMPAFMVCFIILPFFACSLDLLVILLSVYLFLSSGRIPVRLYIRTIAGDIDDLEDAPTVDSWEKISYINRPLEVHGEGKIGSNIFLTFQAKNLHIYIW